MAESICSHTGSSLVGAVDLEGPRGCPQHVEANLQDVLHQLVGACMPHVVTGSWKRDGVELLLFIIQRGACSRASRSVWAEREDKRGDSGGKIG